MKKVKSNSITKELTTLNDIESKIFTIRDNQVMLDSDLARLYGVDIKRLNEQVKRNLKRFPQDFMFQLTKEESLSLRYQFSALKEKEILRSQNATLKPKRGTHRKYLPYVFTEQGVAMLSAVLNSDRAIAVSIQIMNAFVAMRHFISANVQVFHKLESVEKRQLEFERETGKNFEKVFNAIESKEITPKQGILYD
ncbi:MAG: ORF6N domain-containing protein [bacterium]